MEAVLQIIDWCGIAVFAMSGALVAGRKDMDIFGVVVLACVTAVGGGTMRDLFLADGPVFWVVEPDYLAIASASALFTFVIGRYVRLDRSLLLYLDAIGLAVFAILGFDKGFASTGHYGIAIVMAVVTGVGGGILRDLLSNEVPLILRREIYASAVFAGTGLYALLIYLAVGQWIATVAGIGVILVLRLCALHMQLSLPIFKAKR